jgi:hypothetical protein
MEFRESVIPKLTQMIASTEYQIRGGSGSPRVRDEDFVDLSKGLNEREFAMLQASLGPMIEKSEDSRLSVADRVEKGKISTIYKEMDEEHSWSILNIKKLSKEVLTPKQHLQLLQRMQKARPEKQ